MFFSANKCQCYCVTVEKLPQPSVSIVFVFHQVSTSRTDYFIYVVQSIDGPAVGIDQQSSVVNLVTVQIKTIWLSKCSFTTVYKQLL